MRSISSKRQKTEQGETAFPIATGAGLGRAGKKTRATAKQHYKRENKVEDLSDTDSVVSFNTRAMVRRRAELLDTGRLRESDNKGGDESEGSEKGSAGFSDNQQAPSNLDDQFQQVERD